MPKEGEPIPESSVYVYVGLDKNPKDARVGRSDRADTDSYLRKASIFIPTTKFDEWGVYALTDPRFPGYMVDAGTGFNFVSGGQAAPGVSLTFFSTGGQGEGESLQFHLDKLEGIVSKGVKGKAYHEYREVSSGYKGEPIIGERFDQERNKKFAQNLYPSFAKEGNSWGSILNNAIKSLYNGTTFDNMLIRPIRTIDQATSKAIGSERPVIGKPYFGFGVYVYESPDTPNIKSIRKNLNNSPFSKKLVEYVVMVDDDNNIVPLQTPRRSGPYNFPAYQLNPAARKILSLFDGTIYEHGKPSPSGLDVAKIIANYFPEGADQINAMKDFVLEQLKYGPFIVGDMSLTIDKKAQDQQIPVYKLTGKLENGGDDYVVATQGMNVIALPGSPSNFVSLVTSRIYDAAFIPYDKVHGGKKNMGYTIYKVSDAQPPLVIVGAANNSSYGTAISRGLEAPLYSLFMDSDINPNTVDQTSIEDKSCGGR